MFGKTIADAQKKVADDLRLDLAESGRRSAERIAENWEDHAVARLKTINQLTAHNAQDYFNYFNSDIDATGAAAVLKDVDRMLNEVKNDPNKLQVYRDALVGVDRPDRTVNRNIHRRRVFVAAARARVKEIAAVATAYHKQWIVNHENALEENLVEAGLIKVVGGEVI
jgi:hypothetical protein